MPRGHKDPPPEGYTGRAGLDASGPDIQAWIDDGKADCNVVLRLPDDVIGLDVDAYDGKLGKQTMLDAIKRLGPLPATCVITSRDDGVSGIRPYRVPSGRRWRELGPGVEVIQRGWRYMMGPGSIHPDTGATYRCLDATAARAPREIRRRR